MNAGIINYINRKEDIIKLIHDKLENAVSRFIASGIALKSIESLLQNDSFWTTLSKKGDGFGIDFILLSPTLSVVFDSIKIEIMSRGGGDLSAECESIINLIKGKLNTHNVKCNLRFFDKLIPWGFIVMVDDLLLYNPHLSYTPSPISPIFQLDIEKGFGLKVSNELSNYIKNCPSF